MQIVRTYIVEWSYDIGYAVGIKLKEMVETERGEFFIRKGDNTFERVDKDLARQLI